MAEMITVIGLIVTVLSMLFLIVYLWLSDYMAPEWPMGASVLAMTIGLIMMIGGVASKSGAETKRLMAQCMDDGKKEYECKSLLRSNDTTVVPMPIVIPMGR